MTLRWLSDDTFEVDGVGYVCDQYGMRVGSGTELFCLSKIPPIVARYASFLAGLQPRRIVEVGILEGASTALLAQLTSPVTLLAIELGEAPTPKLRDFIARQGLEDVIAVHGGVDQADTQTIDALVERCFDGPLDLVLDDASHLLEPSRATFDCLFPRLRAGGVYLLEDWATGLRVGGPMPLGPGDQPLVELVAEVLRLKGRAPGVVGEVVVRGGWVEIERGTATLEGDFAARTYGA